MKRSIPPRRAATLGGLATLLLLLAGCLPFGLPAPFGLGGPRGNAPRATDDRRPIDAEIASATFDTAWVRIRDTYYDPAMRGVDWEAVREELYPRAAAARTYGALRAVLHDMVGRLGESHFGIVPREAVATLDRVAAGDGAPAAGAPAEGDAGLELRIVDGEMLVTRVTAGSAAETAGVRAGWAVEQVESLDVRRALREIEGLDDVARRDAALRLTVGLARRLAGPPGEAVALTAVNAAGERQELQLERHVAAGEIVQFGNLPPIRAHLEHGVVEHGGARIGVIRYNVWMPVLGADFDRAMAALHDTDGLVLDLRGNTGGVAGLVMRVAGHFIGEPVPLGVLQLRGNELRFVVNPQRVDTDGRIIRTYTRPLALLTDEVSASTTEIFAAGLKQLGRATIFGERTAGQALPAMLFRLPSGDVLMHVVADLRAPDGTRIEGTGVEPHMLLRPTRAELAAGRDRAYEAALDWIIGREPGATVTTDVAAPPEKAAAAAAVTADAQQAERARPDAPHAVTVPADTLRADTLRADTVRADTLRATARADTLRADAARADTIRADTVPAMAPPTLPVGEEPGEPPADAAPLPDGASVLERYSAAIGDASPLLEAGGVRSVGRFEVPASGLVGVLVMVQALPGRSFVRVSLPGYGDVLQGYDGTIGWSISPGEGTRILAGAELDHVREELDPRALLRDASLFLEATTVGRDTFDGERCYRVRLVWNSGRETYDCYSVESGLLIATISPQVTPAGSATVTTLIDTYREFGGILFATRLRQQVLGAEQVIHIESVRLETTSPTLFEPPPAVRALQRRR